MLGQQMVRIGWVALTDYLTDYLTDEEYSVPIPNNDCEIPISPLFRYRFRTRSLALDEHH